MGNFNKLVRPAAVADVDAQDRGGVVAVGVGAADAGDVAGVEPSGAAADDVPGRKMNVAVDDGIDAGNFGAKEACEWVCAGKADVVVGDPKHKILLARW